MSSRARKRLEERLRKLNLESDSKAEDVEESGSEEDYDEQPFSKASVNGFTFLSADEELDSDNDDESEVTANSESKVRADDNEEDVIDDDGEQEKILRAKEEPLSQDSSMRQGPKGTTQESTSKKGSSKNKKSKNRKRSKKSNDQEEFLNNEENILNENLSHQPEKAELSWRERWFTLFPIEAKFLDPDYELQRIFGKKVVRTVNQKSRTKNTRQKYFLIQPKDNWDSKYFSYGIRFEYVKDDTNDKSNVKSLMILHDRPYQDLQRQFYQYVFSHDLDSLMSLLRVHPFHVDSCLQASYALLVDGNADRALELIERALFCFEKGLRPSITSTIGSVEVSFDYPENRPFYLTLWRYTESLMARGCYRTAMEFSKLIASLDSSDPYGMIYYLDYCILRSRNYDYMYFLIDKLASDVDLEANFQYSLALIHYETKNEKFNETLQCAFNANPIIATFILETLHVSSHPVTKKTIKYTKYTRDDYQKISAKLYATRCAQLWNNNDLIIALLDLLETMKTDHLSFSSTDEDLTGIIRHCLISSNPEIQKIIPSFMRNLSEHAFDPIVPSSTRPSLYYSDFIRYFDIQPQPDPENQETDDDEGLATSEVNSSEQSTNISSRIYNYFWDLLGATASSNNDESTH